MPYPGAAAISQPWATETFYACKNWLASLLLYDPSQANTAGWAESEVINLPAENQTFLAQGDVTAGLNATRCMIDLNAAAEGDSFWGCGASNADVANAQAKIIPGARTLGFYFVAANAAAELDVLVDGNDQWGTADPELRTLTQRTHSSVLALNPPSPVPVAAGFYEPNATGAASDLGPGNAFWPFLPVVRACQTKRAFSTFRKITIVRKKNIGAGDRLGIHGKTLQFGLRTPVARLAQIVSGSVQVDAVVAVVYPVIALGGGQIGNVQVGARYSPMSELKLKYCSIDTTNNLLQLDNTVGGKNYHCIRTTDPTDAVANAHGELYMSPGTGWTLTVNVRPF